MWYLLKIAINKLKLDFEAFLAKWFKNLGILLPFLRCWLRCIIVSSCHIFVFLAVIFAAVIVVQFLSLLL